MLVVSEMNTGNNQGNIVRGEGEVRRDAAVADASCTHSLRASLIHGKRGDKEGIIHPKGLRFIRPLYFNFSAFWIQTHWWLH